MLHSYGYIVQVDPWTVFSIFLLQCFAGVGPGGVTEKAFSLYGMLIQQSLMPQ